MTSLTSVPSLTLAILLLGAGCAPDSDGDAALGRPDASTIPDRPDGGFRPTPTGDGGPLDGGSTTPPPPPPPPMIDAAPTNDTPYRNTVVIDGVNDFATVESFPTTSIGFAAYVTYDDNFLYIGYDGPDVGTGNENIWVQFFFDTDAGTAGASLGEVYNTQQPAMPSGLDADYYFRWRASGDLFDVRQFTGGAWGPSTITPTVAQSGTFLEASIPLAGLGNPSGIGVTSLIMKETPFDEACFAGLYQDNFTDGYYAADTNPVPMTRYGQFDFASAANPNAVTNRRP